MKAFALLISVLTTLAACQDASGGGDAGSANDRDTSAVADASSFVDAMSRDAAMRTDVAVADVGSEPDLADMEADSSVTDTGPAPTLRLMVFTKTEGFRHGSIADGLAAIEEMAADSDWEVATTDDAAVLQTSLTATDVVVFLNTTGDILGEAEQDALEAWMRAGGGFVGVHGAADAEYDWPFYESLVGAWFARHPSIQEAELTVEEATHPSTTALPMTWTRTDEWYDFRRNPRDDVQVLLTIDESTYSGAEMGDDHPIAWTRRVDSGRAFYTALGHTSESYAEPLFRSHLAGAIDWAGGRL